MKIDRCILKAYPDGPLSASHFDMESEDNKEFAPLQDGKVLVKLKDISIDPYIRTRLDPKDSKLFPPMQVGKPMEGFCVAEIVASKNEDYPVDSLVTGMLSWETVQVVAEPSAVLTKLPHLEGVPTTFFLGALGITGLTAFFAFKYLAKDFLAKQKEGPVIFVSGAAGAVGSVFGQLCKAEFKGCTVLGSAGSNEKIHHCKSVLGYDDAFNYKEGIASGLDSVLLDGKTIDLYFDNVGGEMLDEVLLRMSMGGKIIVSGQISEYDKKEKHGLKNFSSVFYKHLSIEGFHFVQWMDEFGQASQELGGMLAAKKLVPDETVLHGFDKVVEGLVGLFEGKNTGKMVVSVF